MKSMELNLLQQKIEEAWQNRALLEDKTCRQHIREVIELLDEGKIRVAEPGLIMTRPG